MYYLAYLLEPGRNSAVFAVMTAWAGGENDVEIRVPSPVPTRINESLELLDKHAPRVTTWAEFYAWLGRGKWAAFTPEAVDAFVPGWLNPDERFLCRAAPSGAPVDYLDRSIPEDRLHLLDKLDLSGISPEPEGLRILVQLSSNLVLAERPIFSQ